MNEPKPQHAVQEPHPDIPIGGGPMQASYAPVIADGANAYTISPKQEPKYDIINGKLCNRQSGEPIPEDEPIFILRGRDALAVGALIAYHSSVTNPEHYRAVALRVAQFQKFAEAHPERIRQPDTTITSDWDNL